jgi:hypothetical protein
MKAATLAVIKINVIWKTDTYMAGFNFWRYTQDRLFTLCYPALRLKTQRLESVMRGD